MIVWLRHVFGWLRSAFCAREDLILENLALRQQLLALTVPPATRTAAVGQTWGRQTRQSRVSGGPVYVFRCPVCNKTFERKSYDATLGRELLRPVRPLRADKVLKGQQGTAG
jgi:hypothetical protein